MRFVSVIVLTLAARSAGADPRTDAVARGQQLAKQGDYAGAIAAFREAEASAPHAEHDCLIALAEFRSGELDLAQSSFARCRKRAEASSWTVPPWVTKEEGALAAALAARPAPPPPDPPGPQGGTVRAEVPDAGPEDGGAQGPGAPEVVERGHVRRGHRAALPVLATGGAILVAGALTHLFAVRPARDALVEATTGAEYDRDLGSFETRRNVTVGLYAAGAIVTVIGAVLATRTTDPGPRIGAQVGGDHALVTIGWSR